MLERSMFGNLKRAEPVAEIKRKQPRGSIGFDPQKDAAKQEIRQAALAGKLTVYAAQSQMAEPQVIRPDVLSSIIMVRGGIPDHVGNNVSVEVAPLEGKALRQSLKGGSLVVRLMEFKIWLTTEKRKGKWPSQQANKSKPRRRGRPTIKSEDVRNQILIHVREGRWTGAEGAPTLHKVLSKLFGARVPSEDTLARLLIDLHLELAKQSFVSKGDGLRRELINKHSRTGMSMSTPGS